MLDPVKAFELYAKEISKLELEKGELQTQVKTLKKEVKNIKEKSKEKLRQMGCQVAALEGSNLIGK